MKIVAIGGSPKKGNTFSVLNLIKENYPDIDFKILMLNDINFEWCRGCYTCIRVGAEFCPLKDDRDMIAKEMLDADGVIFASPVYTNHATAVMKNFFERFGYETHRPRFYGKYAMVIAVCAMFGSKETKEYMEGIVGSFGFNVTSSLELGIAANTEQEKKYVREETTKAFDKFITSIKNGESFKPEMGDLVRFNLFKILSELKPDYYEADYQYYKDKTEYPLDVSSVKKKLARKVAVKMVKEFMEIRAPDLAPKIS
jgi:multimeric flavodoxin WrbA